MKKLNRNEGFTLIELLIVVAIIGIIAAIAVPGLLSARMSGNETSAIGSMRAINSGQSTYSSSCANGGYAQTLEDLSALPTGSTSGFISPDLNATNVVKSGYYVNLGVGTNADVVTATACNGTAGAATYFAEAHPVTQDSSGRRAFGTDQRATIFQNADGTPFADGAAVAAATTPVQ